MACTCVCVEVPVCCRCTCMCLCIEAHVYRRFTGMHARGQRPEVRGQYQGFSSITSLLLLFKIIGFKRIIVG